MKTLYVGMARSLWLFDMNLFNPKGLNLQDVSGKTQERYSFAKVPVNMLEVNDERALPFQLGNFSVSSKLPIAVTLTVFNNGIRADTNSSTQDTDAFLQDVVQWLGETFDLVAPEGITKTHISQIGFESEFSLSLFNPGLEVFMKRLESRNKFPDKNARHLEVGASQCWTEDSNKPGAPVQFRVERRHEKPFAANHYFSQAPCDTDAHIQLIKDFEKLLKPKS
jgi:hypothetical protein